jgi:hypothetical protein
MTSRRTAGGTTMSFTTPSQSQNVYAPSTVRQNGFKSSKNARCSGGIASRNASYGKALADLSQVPWLG